MRPKKRVLLIDDDEGQLAVRRFLLVTRGYQIDWADRVDEAIEIICQEKIEMVVISLDSKSIDGNRAVQSIKHFWPEIPVMLVSDVVRPGERVHHADCFLGRGYCAPKDILERVRIMTARKRGPKNSARVLNFAQK